MSDIFISYASEDVAVVRQLVYLLEKHDWSVWWDRSILAGSSFDRAIEEAIDKAKCIIVVWSEKSAISSWVRAEADEGRQRDILVPIIIEETRIPLAFRQIHAINLIHWQPTQADPRVEELLFSIRTTLDKHTDGTTTVSGEPATQKRQIPTLPSARSRSRQLQERVTLIFKQDKIFRILKYVLWGVSGLLVLLLIFKREVLFGVIMEPLPAGSVASRDITAPTDLKIEDEDETKRLRKQAGAFVLPVFDYEPKILKDAVAMIQGVFTTGREADSTVSSEELILKIEEQSGFILKPDQLRALSRHGFNAELEMLMISHLETILATGITSSRSQLMRAGEFTILIRNMSSGNEKTITDFKTTINDAITARASLRSDRLIWPGEYSVQDRILLGEILAALVEPNLFYNEEETNRRRDTAVQQISPVLVAVKKGEAIVMAGETVTPIKASLLNAAFTSQARTQRVVKVAGGTLYLILLGLVLGRYLFYKGRWRSIVEALRQ